MDVREDVAFESDGVLCRGWWYPPAEGDGPAPVVVLGIGLGSVKEMGLDHYARVFAEHGYAALAFDYRHFGDSDGEPRQLLDVASQLTDWHAAVEYARGRDGVDPHRVAVWGTSFGGGHAISLAADPPPGVVAALAQCPFTDGIASALAMSPRSAVKVTVRAVRDLVAERRGRAPVMVATSGPPHTAGLMTAPDADPGFLALVPPGAPFRNEVAARIGVKILGYRPGVHADRIGLPVWVGICDHDSVAPPRRTARLMAKAPRAQVEHYDTGHFDIYTDEWRPRVLRDQLAFLDRHLRG